MKKKYLGLICIIYSLLFLYIFIKGNMGNYLAPQMHKNIIISMIILFVIGIVVLFSKKFDYKFKISDLILLLPILLLFFAGDGRLTTTLASNRTSSFDSVSKANNKKDDKVSDNNNLHEVPVVPEEVKNNTVTKTDSTTVVDYDIVDEVYSVIADRITFTSHPEKLIGKTIRVRGFVLLNNEMFSKEYFAIGKYFVSCCIADSSFGGFVAKYNDMSIIKDNGWYEIEGVLNVGKSEFGTDMVYIDVKSIKTIDEKKEQLYVYPCYSYGDGSCSALDNYDIEIDLLN